MWCDTNAGIRRTILRISQVMRRKRRRDWIKEKVNVDGLSAEPHPERNAQ